MPLKPKTVPPKKSTTNTAPDWPPLHPPLAPQKQRLTSLLPSAILTTPLLPAPLAQTYRSFLATLPLTTTPFPKKRDHALRVNDRFSVSDATFASRLWHDTGLATLVQSGHMDGEDLTAKERAELWGGEVLGLNSNIRIYRYREGQFFDRHYDEENLVTFEDGKGGEKIKGRTTWTLLVYLSGRETGCEGGETVFWPDEDSAGGFGKGRGENGDGQGEVVAEMEVGLALLHRHGRECLLHEGREVKRGEKWVIRSDLVVRR
ncbi:2OG-Fe(II) oxygenase-like protein 6 [Elsinoe australis]|uniref:2OG-Fe(II) oxygenase-like protein 6 n=1 Tax=Elsinoe australis TaxID=40998 RepID=A0A4U7ARL9_9PEZI|nr:2OG-Fe(II) oxygenase-like protein 6 [Elsinoe australis]